MSKNHRAKDHGHNTGTDKSKPDPNRKPVVDHAANPEDKEGTALHQGETYKKPHIPTPSEFIAAVYQWLLHRRDAPREKSKAADWAVVALTICIAVAAIWSAVSIQGQLSEARRLTEISERPWLSVEEIRQTKDLGFINMNGHQAAAFGVRLTIKNVGHSIAKSVQIDAKMFPTAASGTIVAPEAIQRQRELCDHPILRNIQIFDLFPDQPIEPEVTIGTPPSGVDAQAAAIAGDKSRMFVGLYFVGCITYRSSFGSDLHQTRFAYHLIPPGPVSPDGKPQTLQDGTALLIGFEVGIRIPKDKIGMIPEIFALNDAN